MQFPTTLLQFGPNNTGIDVPAAVVAALGNGRLRLKVVVTVNGYSYRSTIAPYSGLLLIPFAAEHRAATGLRGGEAIVVDLVLDEEPRVVAVPDDLAAALGPEPDARAFFDGLSYTNRRSFVLWVEEAKKPETRAARVERSVAMLRERKTR